MAFRLIPQDTSFYAHFAEAGQHAARAARLLTDLIGVPQSERPQIAEELSRVESEADDTTHEIIRRANASLITPFDHVDLLALARALDDCVDEIEATGAMVSLYRVGAPSDGVVDMVGVVARMADLTASAMPRLRSVRRLEDYWIEINRLENQADLVYRRLLADLFDGRRTDAVEILKLKDVIDRLEACADAFEAVAHTVESLAVKET